MHIRKATHEDKLEIARIRPLVYKSMLEAGFHQWDNEYPSEEILFNDIDKGEMLVATIDSVVAGYITVNGDIPEEYDTVSLQFDSKICIHRLSVNPQFARQRVATKIMEFVHAFYKENGHTSICLDTCEANVAALKLYERLGYITRGYVQFSRREQYRFPVMERML